MKKERSQKIYHSIASEKDVEVLFSQFLLAPRQANIYHGSNGSLSLIKCSIAFFPSIYSKKPLCSKVVDPQSTILVAETAVVWACWEKNYLHLLHPTVQLTYLHRPNSPVSVMD